MFFVRTLTSHFVPYIRGRERQIYTEYALYEANVTVTGILSNASIIEVAVDDAADHADEEGPSAKCKGHS